MKFTRHLTCLLAFALLLPAGAQAKDLHLYVDDGSDHVYLGCFSCSPYDSNSIWGSSSKPPSLSDGGSSFV